MASLPPHLRREPGLVDAFDRLDNSTVTTLTASATITTRQKVVLCNTGSNSITVTLPRAIDAKGYRYDIKKMAASNTMTIASADNIDGSATQSTTTQYDSFTVFSTGATWVIL